MRSRRRILVALAAASLAAVGVTSATAERLVPPGSSSGDHMPSGSDHVGMGMGGRPPGAPLRTEVAIVTLVTGDRVRLTSRPDGTQAATPMPGKGRSAEPFSIRYRGSRIDVVPADAAPLLAAGRLDQRLFDVAGLAAAGYDDAHSRTLPLLVTYQERSGPTVTRGASAVSRGPERPGTKMSASKDDMAAFWQWIAGPHPAEPDGLEAVAAVGPAGVESVSLDLPKRPIDVDGGTGRDRGTDQDAATNKLTIRLFDRNGRLVTKLGGSFLTEPVVLDRDTQEVIDLEPASNGLFAMVPDGHYSFGEIVVTSHGLKPNSYSLLARPDFEVIGNTSLTLDAREAKRVTVTVDAPDARRVVTTFGTVETFAGRPWTTLVTLPGAQRYPLFATPTASVTNRPYDFTMFQTLNSRRGVYDLVVGDQGRIPADNAYKVRDADLSKIDVEFFAAGTGLNVDGVFFREAELPGDVQVGLGWFYDTPIPASRLHLASAEFVSSALPWANSLDVQQIGGPLWYSELRDPHVVPLGQVVQRPWDSAGYRPEGNGERTGTVMNMSFEPFSPALPDTRLVVWNEAGITGTVKLERSGATPDESKDPFELLTDPQPPALTWYRVELDAKRAVPWSKYAVRTHATWDFNCQRPPSLSHRMRLLNVRPTGDFDMFGRGPAGKAFRIDLHVDTVARAGTATSTTLEVSYDDGTTWTNVPTSMDSPTLWHAMVMHPNKPGGFVSLRTSVTTDNGHKASLTSIRAYGLAPSN